MMKIGADCELIDLIGEAGAALSVKDPVHIARKMLNILRFLYTLEN